VAKEFVAARDDEDGVLILSRFAGASQELTDALVVNPYDIEETTTALVQALRMTPQERVARMLRLRQVVREHNVYRWGAELVRGLARLGPVAPAPEEERMPALGAPRP
ncbi:MAG: trehalose-6-phosphate synthase, partial [Gemmatimonadetes bacterium]|nr:trehalose-6-phosphate synthase [Gemmatimonadota bacterium]